MTEPKADPIKKKMVPYNAEAIPAVWPIGSIARALLLGSIARLSDINSAIAIKNTNISGRLLATTVMISNTVATRR